MSFGKVSKYLEEAKPSQVRIAAMNHLARREHSFSELIHKLCDKGVQHDLAESVVQELMNENLQSDARFAESMVNSYIRKGRGPQRIQMDLNQYQVDEYLYHQALREIDVDWEQLAIEVYQRKYGSTPCEDFAEKAKRMRFLQGRGFTSGQIQGALRSNSR